MQSNETSLVIEAGSEVGAVQRVAARRETATWLGELSEFATAMLVTSAAVVLAGAIVVLFCYAFFITTPIAVVAIVLATAREVRRQRALAH